MEPEENNGVGHRGSNGPSPGMKCALATAPEATPGRRLRSGGPTSAWPMVHLSPAQTTVAAPLPPTQALPARLQATAEAHLRQAFRPWPRRRRRRRAALLLLGASLIT